MTVNNPPRRLRLRRLHIENFRGIDTLDLDLTGGSEEALDLVVLGGDNGCGKTAVLEAALLLLGKQRLLPNDTVSLREQVRFGASDFRIEGEIQYGPSTFSLSANLVVLEHPTRQKTFFGAGVANVPNGEFWQAPAPLNPEIEYFSARRDPDAGAPHT